VIWNNIKLHAVPIRVENAPFDTGAQIRVQCDAAPLYNRREITWCFKGMFERRWLWPVAWPPRSPDL